MAETILGSLLRPTAFKMSSEKGAVSLAGLAVESVSIKLNSRTLKNRREDGTVIAHARIKTPMQVQVKVVAQTIDGVQILSQIMNNVDEMYSIQTRGVKLKNVKLQRMEQSQSPEALSATPIMLVFAGIQMQGIYRPVCVQQGDSSVIDSGIATLNDVGNNVSEFASGVAESLGVLF